MKRQEYVQAMQKDLDAYRADSANAKQLFVSMKEISSWLIEKASK